jgi:hypothetical protein
MLNSCMNAYSINIFAFSFDRASLKQINLDDS